MTTLAIDANSKPIPVVRPSTVITVATSGTSAQSSAIGANCRVARIVCTEDCHYTFGATATTSDSFLPAGVVEYVHVYGGDQIAVIQNSTAGTLFITEMY